MRKVCYCRNDAHVQQRPGGGISEPAAVTHQGSAPVTAARTDLPPLPWAVAGPSVDAASRQCCRAPVAPPQRLAGPGGASEAACGAPRRTLLPRRRAAPLWRRPAEPALRADCPPLRAAAAAAPRCRRRCSTLPPPLRLSCCRAATA